MYRGNDGGMGTGETSERRCSGYEELHHHVKPRNHGDPFETVGCFFYTKNNVFFHFLHTDIPAILEVVSHYKGLTQSRPDWLIGDS